MSITLLGGALIPLCALFCLSPGGLLTLIEIYSVFGAAAVLIIGGAGLQPALLPAALVVGCLMLQALLGAAMPGARHVLRVLTPMLWLGLYALVSALILPRIFDGVFEIWPQKPEAPMTLPAILHPGPANVTQTLYLWIDLALLGGAAIYLAPRPQALVQLFTVYLLCGYAVAAFCLWQLVSKLFGVPFPEDLLYSNPGWSILSDQALDGVPRISGSFAEPASLAFCLCGSFFACAWLLLRGHRHKLAKPLLLITLLCLLISTSTTGFVVLALGVVIGVVYGLMVAREAVLRVLHAALPVMGGVLLAGLVVSILLPGVTTSAAIVAARTLAKSDSESFESRTREDFDSLSLFIPTYGLGIGWGSNRSSSLLPGLIGGLGLPGVILPIWFVMRLRNAAEQARSSGHMGDSQMAIDGFGAATLGSLLTAVVSAPMIVSAMFYLNLAALIAGLVQVRLSREYSVRLMAGLMVVGFVGHASLARAGEPEFFAGVATHFAQAPQVPEPAMSTRAQRGGNATHGTASWNVIEPHPGIRSVPDWLSYLNGARTFWTFDPPESFADLTWQIADGHRFLTMRFGNRDVAGQTLPALRDGGE